MRVAGGTQSPMCGEHQGPPPDRGSVIICRMRFSRKPHMVIFQLHFIRSIVPLGQPCNLITKLSGLYLPSRLPSATTGKPGLNHHPPSPGSCPTSPQVPWPPDLGLSSPLCRPQLLLIFLKTDLLNVGSWMGPWNTKRALGTSLVVQWVRIYLPTQGTRVRSQVWKDPTCHGTTSSVYHC